MYCKLQRGTLAKQLIHFNDIVKYIHVSRFFVPTYVTYEIATIILRK